MKILRLKIFIGKLRQPLLSVHPAQDPVLTIKQLYGILIPLAFMIIKNTVEIPPPLHIGIQPVKVHNLKFSFASISKRAFLSGPRSLSGDCEIIRERQLPR